VGRFKNRAVSGVFAEHPVSADLVSGVENGDAVTFIEQVFGCGNAGRACADDANGFWYGGHGLEG